MSSSDAETSSGTPPLLVGPSLLVGIWLVVLWVLLWGELSWANIIAGTIIAVAVMRFQRHLRPARGEDAVAPRPLAALSLVAYVAWAVVMSTVDVIRSVVRPSRVRTAVIAVPLRTTQSGVVTTVANAVTLTPGTMSLAVSGFPPVLYVHALNYSDRESIVADVRRFEDLAAAVIGVELEPLDAHGGVVAEDVDDPGGWESP